MKQVIKDELNNPIFLLSNIRDNHIVGVEFKDGKKSIILPASGYNYAGYDLITDRPDTKWFSTSKREYASTVMYDQDAKVFVFDTLNELLSWLE